MTSSAEDHDNSNKFNNDSADEREVFLPLTDLVRQQYCNYLEKQLCENLTRTQRQLQQRELLTDANENVQECCRLLEQRAITACMHAPRYRRCMLKIIALVRRSTQECRLDSQLKELITRPALSRRNQSTQTDSTITAADLNVTNAKSPQAEFSITLEKKIERFQEHLNEQKSGLNKRSLSHRSRQGHETRPKYARASHHKANAVPLKTKQCTGPKESQPPIAIGEHQPCSVLTIVEESTKAVTSDPLEQTDLIAQELARLFSEEKTVFDELLGTDPNKEPDDPQVCSILKEIESSKLTHERQQHTVPESSGSILLVNSVNKITQPPSPQFSPIEHNDTYGKHPLEVSTMVTVDLRHSLWPCELFMQRRCLVASLTRLVEEDLRWYDIMRWKFSTLFGEDSDDEFASCSPSIELDEVLMGSCIKRISPWMVKYLMKPMQDGLISNRFLFKKLAKKLAHNIVLECQYPDKHMIKRAVEEFFCLHQAVYSLDDLEDFPNLRSIISDSTP